MEVSNYFSALAILVSIIGIGISYKNYKSNQILSMRQEKLRKMENKLQVQLNNTNSRIAIIPHFHLELEDEIYLKEQNNKKKIILPIKIINLGRESATNVRLIPLKETGDFNSYFKTNDDVNNHKHFVHDYLDKQYALPQEVISFSVRCEFHSNAYDVYFKIQFNDLIGRTYQQDFKFQYCKAISNNFSYNNYISVPICINVEDKTEV